MTESYDTLTVTLDEDTGIGRVTLDRPDELNAINEQMQTDLAAVLDWFEAQDAATDGVATCVVVLEGAGEKAFSAGADVMDFSDRSPGAFDPRTVLDHVKDFPAPLVAKIDGYCLGGGMELALACDLRVASADSTFGLPEVDLGLLPGGGGIQYVASLAGPALAMEMAMTGDHYPAEFAADAGILTAVHSVDEFEEGVEEFVGGLAEKPPLALRAIKDAANQSVEVGQSEGRRYDRRVFTTLLETEDAAKAAQAFGDDEQPEFEGR